MDVCLVPLTAATTRVRHRYRCFEATQGILKQRTTWIAQHELLPARSRRRLPWCLRDALPPSPRLQQNARTSLPLFSLSLVPSPTPLSHQMLLLLPPRLSPRSSHFPSVRSDLKTRVFVPASSTLQPAQHSAPRDTRRHQPQLSFPQPATHYIFISR